MADAAQGIGQVIGPGRALVLGQAGQVGGGLAAGRFSDDLAQAGWVQSVAGLDPINRLAGAVAQAVAIQPVL